ncbi:MAG: endo-1,4-beta-xylanase, partial [Lachnospiraceae bacterium]|nr:endo-1,4-beta-xylanase [Lachnospiraceae bacterium]
MNSQVMHRCQTAKVKVVDKTGKALANTAVSFNLTNHEFLFGCGGFDALPLTSNQSVDKLPKFDNEELKKAFFKDRMDKWLGLFNYATIPFYWGGYEPTEGEPLFESRYNAAKFFIDHNVSVKGHPLCWHTVCADWLLKYDDKTIMDKQLERINRDVTAFKGIVDKWDVINETVIMPSFDRYDNAVTRICKRYGRIPLIKEVFEAAHSANPSALLLINDFNLSDEYKKVISDALDAGAKIGAIGLQSHQHQGYKGLPWFEAAINRFKEFGLPIHFTENTLISGDIMPSDIVDLNDYVVDEWPSTPEGEERQAKEWEEIYVRLFNEPSVEAITGWDFADGAWLNAPSGIVRADNTLKPVYHVLKDYIHKTWSTNETLVTDENGFVTLTGYRGFYEVSSPSL